MELIGIIKESWGWTGIKPEQIIASNDFANLIVLDSDEKYWRLCPEELYLEEIADSRGQLEALFKDPDFQEDWEMAILVSQAQRHLGALGTDQRYYLVIPSVLGGGYDVTNIRKAPLSEIIALSGDIARQIDDLPDGAQIKLDVIP